MEGFDAYTKFQTVGDWGAVAHSGRSFAWFKGTDGMTTRDTADWPAKAKQVGIACGLYGYAQPGNPVDQYNLLLSTARARGALALSPALDLENPFVPGTAAAQFAIGWLRRAVEAGQIPVFYANDSMMSYILATVRAAVPSVWPWIARYGAAPKNPYQTWQYSSSGSVPGISGAVDLNKGNVPLTTNGSGGGTAAGSGEDEDMERVDCAPIKSAGYVELHPGGSDQARVTIYPGPGGVWIEKVDFWGDGHVPGDNQTGGLGGNPTEQHGGQPFLVEGITTFTRAGCLLAGVGYSSDNPFYIIARG